MRVTYTDFTHTSSYFTNKFVYSFKINHSILKTHFKKLMRMSGLYDSKEKTGAIYTEYKDEFLELLRLIEKPSYERTKKSHHASIEKRKIKDKNMDCSFEDFCSEFFDQNVCMMSENDKKESMAAYQKHLNGTW